MPVTIDYFFTSISPWTYLGHDAVIAAAARHDAVLKPRPMVLATVFETSGAVPLAKRTPARQRYRLIELQRAMARRSLPLNLHPKFFPADPALADHCSIAVERAGGDPFAFMRRVFSGVWARDENIADEDAIHAMLAETGNDAAAILKDAGSGAVRKIREKNTEDAIAAGAVGAPCYVLSGEPFWGQDRIDDLDEALASGRTPYTA